jgi:hypothetical protein
LAEFTAASLPIRQLYRVSEAMILLSLSRSVIYELIRSGRLRSVTEGTGAIDAPARHRHDQDPADALDLPASAGGGTSSVPSRAGLSTAHQLTRYR